MSRVRILQLISGLAIGDQSGGAEFHAVQVARHLDKIDFDPVIFAAWSYGSPAEAYWLDNLASEGIAVEGLTPWTNNVPSDSTRIFRSLWSTVKHFKPHIIHSHSERFDSLNSFLRVFHPRRPAAVRTIHLDRQWQTHPRLGPIINSSLFPILFKFEMAVSRAIYQQLLDSRLRSEDKIGLCYNGIDAVAFTKRPDGKSRNLPDNLPSEGPRIGIIGRLTDQKGHADLITAVQIVNQQRPVHLVIAGDGPLQSELRNLTNRLDLGRYVHFLGTRNDIWELWPHLDLFVLPSYWEGFPTVILEAMSQEVPVIATDIPGTRELVQSGSTGLLVQPGKPVVLAEAILTVLNDPPGSLTMAKHAREVASQFTIQNTVKCYSKIYRRVVRS